MTRKKFTSVWDAIENTPGQAASMKARSELMIALQEHLKKSGMTQTQAAAMLGVTQPRISDLLRGRINLFSVESLIDMISAAGLQVKLSFKRTTSSRYPVPHPNSQVSRTH